jgi:hypothetical protein
MGSDEVDRGETPKTDWEMEMGTRMDTNRNRAGERGPRVDRPGIDRPRRRRASRSLLIGLATAILIAIGIGVASAGAISTSSSGIEGVWEFRGGQIAIQETSPGTLTGTVVVPTKFAECVHPVPQKIWTEMKLQPDGSYWGLHQWYQGYPACNLDSTLGKTAWRELEGTDGSHYLRVCLSAPSNNLQPTIAPDGAPYEPSEYAAYHVTYGCFKSEFTAPLSTPSGGTTGTGTTGSGTGTGTGTGIGIGKSGVAGSKVELKLPSNKQCLSLRLFKIHLPEPKYDPFQTVSVTLKGRKIATVHKGNYVVATIALKGLHKGAFTINVKVTTVLGQHLSDSRTYHTCVRKKRKPRNKLKLSKEKT